MADASPDAVDDYALLYYRADELLLDYRHRVCNSVVYDRDGSVRGRVFSGNMRPWGGRPPESCKFKPGQIVGFVTDVYRQGVVLGLPPSPDEARRWSDVSLGDVLYLLGVVHHEDPFNPDRWDHEHVTEPELFAAPADVPDVLREALRHRCLGTQGFPPWSEQAQRAARDPDAVIARVLARFHDDAAKGKAGATRATLVLDTTVCFLSSALRAANFQVVDVGDHADDFESRRRLLAHRIVVTKNTSDYLDLAPVLDLGIIGIDAL
jgi:hypothetical protein